MARTMPPRTRSAGSSGPTTVDALRDKIKTKVHGKPEDLSNYLVLWAEYFAANDMASLTELYKSAPPAIKAKLAELFPTHEVITKNHKGKTASGPEGDLEKAVADLATGELGKKELSTKDIKKLMKSHTTEAIDAAVEALNKKEG
jgi:hypothetical protein